MQAIRKHLFSLLAGVIVVALLVYAFWPRPVEVDLAQIVRGSLRVTVDEDGRTRIRERYVVSAPLTGRLLRIDLKPGDVVSAGRTVLAVIEPTDPALLDDRARAEAEARVREAEAVRKQTAPKLERARAVQEQARASAKRAARLLASNNISQEEHDVALQAERVAVEDVKTAQLGVQIAEHELELARAALVRTRPRSPGDAELWRFEIHSPIDGRVLRVVQESTAVVTPGQKLLEVGDPSDLEVEVDLLSSDAVKVVPGAKAFFEHWGGETPLMGRVRLVEPAGFLKISALGVEEQRVNVILDFDGPPEPRARLGDAYRVEARIVVWEADDVLKAPAGALFRQGDDWAVYAVVNGRTELRRLRVGPSNGMEREVLEGLQDGDTVVLHPGDRITPGVRVVAR